MGKRDSFFHFSNATSYIYRLSQKSYVVFLLAAFLGFLFFVFFYGLKIVNPFFTDWLNGGDLRQHFIGWEFFRHEAWTFPIGSIKDLAYPFGISLSYTDSIPLVAIPLKLFEPLLPQNFQYFGMWGVVCFMLQGGFAALIMRRWTKNALIILLCVVVFLLCPVMLQRMFTHTALASQWIILASIWLLLERQRLNTLTKQLLVWAGILSLAIAIHPYFVPMVALLLIISSILTHKTWTRTLIKIVIPLLASIIVFWIIGGFAVGVDGVATYELGEYALNLNSLYNPWDWSKFLPTLPSSGESMNYLGLGMLLLIPVVACISLVHLSSVVKLREKVKRLRVRHLFVVLAVACYCVISISPKIQYGMHVLAQFTIPAKVNEYWSIFRATARLFWVIYYLIIVGILSYIIRAMKQSSQIKLIMVIVIFVGIQVADIIPSSQVQTRRLQFSEINKNTYRSASSLHNQEWNEVAGSRSHYVFLGNMKPEEFLALADIPMSRSMTMNTGYFARAPYKNIEEYQNEQKRLLLNKQADTRANLYVTSDYEFAQTLQSKGYNTVYIDGYYVVK